MPAPKFIMVRSTNPHRDGQYSRQGLRFTRAWRALEVDNVDDRDVPAVFKTLPNGHEKIVEPEVINTPVRAARGEEGKCSFYTLAVLEKDEYLAVKPATESDIARLQDEQANGGDKDATIEAQQQRIADLEARLMRLEAAASKGAPRNTDKATPPLPKAEDKAPPAPTKADDAK